MTGERENGNERCPLCAGRLIPDQRATIPFVLEDTVIVIKDVPAEVCTSCHEPFLSGAVTDQVTERLRQLQTLAAEVSVISYDASPVMA